MLLLVQVLGLGHVALARHTLSDSGAVVDTAGLATELHQDRGGHLCSDVVAVHEDGLDDCVVLAQWRAASMSSPAMVVQPPQSALSGAISSSSFVGVQLDVLSRAPKASPPQG